MRQSEDEPAAVVLAKLRASEPRAPQAPATDATFPQRYQAWREAIVREEVRAGREESRMRERAEKSEDDRERKELERRESDARAVEPTSPEPTSPASLPKSATGVGGSGSTPEPESPEKE